MAGQDFDFSSFKELKIAQYKKEYCKAAIVKKAKAAILFTDYKMAGKKTQCVMITFKKPAEAQKAFKKVKAEKEHMMKKTALASVLVNKDASGVDQINLDIKKGGLDIATLQTKGATLFGSLLKLKLNVTGGAVAEETGDGEDIKAEGTGTDNKAEIGDAKPSGKKLTPEQKEKIKENMTKIGARLELIAKKLKL